MRDELKLQHRDPLKCYTCTRAVLHLYTPPGVIDGLRVIDPGEGAVGDRHIEEVTQRPPALLHLVLQEPVCGHLGPHLRYVLPVELDSGLLARGHCAEHVQARGGGGRHHLVVHHLDEGVCAHEGVEPAAGPGLHGEVQRQDGAPHTLIPPHTGDI